VHKKSHELKKIARERIRKRIRIKISGTAERPRVHVFKSNRFIYLQAVDDVNGKVLATASSHEKEFRAKDKNKNVKNLKASQLLGEMMAKRLKDMKLDKIVFDRGIYPYHGRVKAVAEGIRKGGLVF